MSKSTIVTKTPISSSNMNGIQLVIFSLIFMSVGIFIMGVSKGHFLPPSKMNAPPIIVLTAGLAFFLAGSSVFIQGVLAIRRRRKSLSLMRRNLNSPWFWDYHWNSKGVSNRSQNSYFQHFFGLSIMGCFYFITYWIGYINKAQFRYPFYGMSFFVLLIIFWFYTMISKRVKYGKPFIQFRSFPFKLGQDIGLKFESLPPKEKIKEIFVTIRFYEEFFTKNTKGQSVVSLKSTYEESLTLPSSAVTSQREVSCNFKIPIESKFKSKLSSKPAKFWEVQIQCDIEGWYYREYYLLPIYG